MKSDYELYEMIQALQRQQITLENEIKQIQAKVRALQDRLFVSGGKENERNKRKV